MKFIRMFTTVVALFLLPSFSVRLAAQDNPSITPKHHHYKFIDMGTFGGPSSSTQDELRVLSRRGMVAGEADTSIPNHPYACIFCGGPLITHAFQWRNGVLHDLGALPGDNSSGANWISDSGFVAGGSESVAIDPLLGIRELHAVLWKNGQITDLGTLEGGHESDAFAVNSRGQVAGGGFNTIPDPFSFLGTQQRVFLWQNGIMEDVGTLGGPDAGLLGGPPVNKGNIEMNERGQVVACSYVSSNPNPGTGVPTVDPFLWDSETGMHDLGGFGGTTGCAIYLNNRGQVVGYSNLPGDLTAHPFLWSKPGPMQDLGTLGGTFGFANWISEAGEIAGTASTEGDQAVHAFLWKNGIMTDLGTLPGDSCSQSQAVNSKRQMVGESSPCDFTSARAFLWENGGPMVDLNDLVPSGSGLQLNSAVDINDRGEIVGSDVLPNGDTHAVLLIPCDESHRGVEGCDYSMVDEPTATRVSPAPVMQRPASAIQSDLVRQMLLRRLGLWSRMPGLMRESQLQKFSGNTTSTSAPIVALSSTSLAFPTQAIGTTSGVKTVALKNTGTTSLTITSIAIVGTNAGDFAQTHTCGSSLAAGASCSMSVTFKPTASGTRTAALSISDNATGSPQKVSLSGTGSTAKLSPTGVNFGTVALGSTSSPKTVTLTNLGTTTLTISGIAITGTDAGDFTQSHNCGSSLAAAASCSISITFRPTTPGTRTAALSISDNADGSPQRVSLSGTGTTAKLSPSSLSFGSVTIGDSSALQTVTLTNVGTTSLNITGIAITGSDPDDFAQTHTCGSSLAASVSCSISVTFKPTASGTRTAELSVSDNGGGSPQIVPLSGTGVAGFCSRFFYPCGPGHLPCCAGLHCVFHLPPLGDRCE